MPHSDDLVQQEIAEWIAGQDEEMCIRDSIVCSIGKGQLFMMYTLLGSVLTPAAETKWSKYYISF